MSAARFWFSLVLVVALQGPLPAQTAGRGWPVRVERVGTIQQVRGELIAAQADSIWVLSGSQLVSVPVSEVRVVRLKRRPIGAPGIFVWGAIGGLATGVGLSLACASYEDGEGCGGILAGSVVVWGVWSVLSAAVAGSAYSGVGPSQFETRLRPFARFPQGLPPGFDPGTSISAP